MVCLATALLAGCATSPTPRVEPVGSGASAAGLDGTRIDHLEERALLYLLSDRRTYEGVAVGAGIDGPPDLRRQTALALARIGDPRCGTVLVSLLADPEPSVRRAAVFGLGEVAELRSGEGQQGAEGLAAAAAALLGMVNDADRESGRLAAEGLAKAGVTVETVVERLIQGASEEFFPRLLPALFRFQSRQEPSSAVVRWAREGLREENGELQAMAAYALARTPLEESAPDLRELLGDAQPWVRGWAARALGEVGERSDVERLRPLLDDSEPGPIVHALRSAKRLIDAGKSSAPYDWQPRLLELMDDGRPGVRLTAIEASAGWLLDEELSERLARFAASGSPRERQLAILALAEGEDPDALSWIAAAAEAPEVATRRAAAEATGLAGVVEVLDLLELDPHPAVRAAVLDTWLSAEPPDAAEKAARALADSDPGLRATAFEWLENHPVLPLEILAAGVEASNRDRILDARIAGVRALSARARAEPLERGTLMAVLEVLAADGEYLVRRQAAADLLELGGKQVDPGGMRIRKPVEYYREVLRRTRGPRRVEIRTERGDVTVELACTEAPLTCLNFLQLGTQGFYDGLAFHRVVPDFVVQAGDPRGDGRGGPGYSIRDEINLLRYDRGTVGMALSGPNSGGSQFFITLSAQPHLDGGYTVFGRVIAGLDVLEQIVEGDRILGISELGAP